MLDRLTPAEIASGWVFGYGASPPDVAVRRSSVLETLERVILAASSDRPWYVLFSGGRDSSVILAAALRAARRSQLPDPIPVIVRYPFAAGTEETEWQDRVLVHLDLSNAMIISCTDESDLLAPTAVASLMDTGAVFPPAAHCMTHVYERLRGGVIFTGECGDEVFGNQRVTPLRNIFAERGIAGAPHVRRIWGSIQPAWVAQREGFASTDDWLGWLSPATRRDFVRACVRERQALPFHWSQSMKLLESRRAIAVAARTRQHLAARHGCNIIDPFWTRPVIEAVAQFCGRWGLRSRSATLEALFSDILPIDVLRRPTKAYFNHAYFSSYSRGFVADWDGTGLEDYDIDQEALRVEWNKDLPSGASYLLLQTAYLAALAKAATSGHRA